MMNPITVMHQGRLRSACRDATERQDCHTFRVILLKNKPDQSIFLLQLTSMES
jgi:hypothetical protein